MFHVKHRQETLMDTPAKLPVTEALAAYGAVVRHYADAIPLCRSAPRLVEGWEKPWDSPQPVVPWAIVWEDGPDEWAFDASHNDVVPRDLAYAEPARDHVLALYPA
jgi:hypothetical protein